MFKLIKNEYQKLFCKKGTYVLLIMVLLITAGYQFLMNSSFFRDSNSWSPDREYVQNELEWLKSINISSDYDNDIALHEAMLKYEIYDAASYGASQSWKGAALSAAYDYYPMILNEDNFYSEEDIENAKNLYDTFINAIETDNWKIYYQTLIDLYGEENTAWSFPYRYMLEHDIHPDSGDWRINVVYLMQNYADKMTLYENLPEEERGEQYTKLKQAYDILQYRLDNDIQYCVIDSDGLPDYESFDSKQFYSFDTDLWSSVYKGSSILTFVCIMMIVVAGGIIASEFSQGTIKFLLINPVSRSKIFFSKYIMLLSLTIFMSVGLLFANMVLAPITGAGGFNAVYLTYEGGKIISCSVFPIIFTQYAFLVLENIVIMTLSFMISSLLRSSSVAIGVSLGVLFLGNTVTVLLAAFGQDWGRFLIFANTNLSTIIQKQSMFPHHSLGFAIAVIAAHMIIFLLSAYDGFTRREV